MARLRSGHFGNRGAAPDVVERLSVATSPAIAWFDPNESGCLMTGETALIAVVDDDEDVRVSLEALISSVGHEVALFESAEDLLGSKVLTEAACVVSDVQMPGTNGIQLARRLQSRSGPPVILMTAYPAASLERTACDVGVRRLLHKPFAPDDLLCEIDELLN